MVLEKGGEDHLELSLRTEVVLNRVKEDRNILHTVKMKANWTGRTLRRYHLLKRVIAGKVEDRTEVRERCR